jgi:hypothetical protein
MQIAGNKGAESSNFIRWFEKIRYHYGHHASGGRGSDPVGGNPPRPDIAEARCLAAERLSRRDRVQACRTRSRHVPQSHETAPQDHGLSGDAPRYDEPRTWRWPEEAADHPAYPAVSAQSKGVVERFVETGGRLSCVKPRYARAPATRTPSQLTQNGMLKPPISTCHPKMIRSRCIIATTRNSVAVTVI